MEKINNIKVLIADPENGITVKEVPNTLETFQELVGGHIETFCLEPGLLLVLDEEGKLKGKKACADLYADPGDYGDELVGTIVAVGVDGDEFCGITGAQMNAVLYGKTRRYQIVIRNTTRNS